MRIHHYIPPASAYGLGYEPDPLKKERVLKEQERQRRKKKYEVKQSGIDDGQEAQKVAITRHTHTKPYIFIHSSIHSFIHSFIHRCCFHM